jgi:hypothetical protein
LSFLINKKTISDIIKKKKKKKKKKRWCQDQITVVKASHALINPTFTRVLLFRPLPYFNPPNTKKFYSCEFVAFTSLSNLR